MKDHNGAMTTLPLQAIEDRSAAVAKGPRVTLEDIKSAIDSVHYINASSLLQRPVNSISAMGTLAAMTVCMIVMKNGFVVFGEAAPADPKNYSKIVGEQNAYEVAFKKLWPLMGFALRDQLHQREQFDREPKMGEGTSAGRPHGDLIGDNADTGR